MCPSFSVPPYLIPTPTPDARMSGCHHEDGCLLSSHKLIMGPELKMSEESL